MKNSTGNWLVHKGDIEYKIVKSGDEIPTGGEIICEDNETVCILVVEILTQPKYHNLIEALKQRFRDLENKTN